MRNHTDETGTCFSAADILLPPEALLPRWAVIACDQFTSQPEYWKHAEALAGDSPSALRLILPEAELQACDEERIRRIHDEMERVLHEGLLRQYPDCFVYVERGLKSGAVRRGIIGRLDLDAYDYTGTENVEVRATEETVAERIPPRMAVRRGAPLELPHVLLLCDDDRRQVIEPLEAEKSRMQKLYDFDLMLGGGPIAGWLVEGEQKAALERRLSEYEACERGKHPGKRLLYAVGDGNHSLATAKACFEEWKEQHPGEDAGRQPMRYALCELNNIHAPEQHFEPIHRMIRHCDPARLLHDLETAVGAADGDPIPWRTREESGVVKIRREGDLLPLAVLQKFLDGWLRENAGEIDYIHGREALEHFCTQSGTIGFLLPPIEKDSLFPGILSGGSLPRKTFSMGEAEEKRYYLEARRIGEV